MTRRRWIADEVSGDRAVLNGDHADHLIRVLRVRVGQEFDVVAGSAVRFGKVAAIGEDRVEFDLGAEIPASLPASVTLLLAIFKFDRMEWAVEKCTELGVSRIIPLIARRTDLHLAKASAKRVERWQRIARQATEQSRRSGAPEVTEPMKIKEAVSLAGELRILLAESETRTQLREALQPGGGEGNVLLAVGPEGGWSEEELHLFHAAGWVSASLGQTILRAETAAIAAVAVTLSSL